MRLPKRVNICGKIFQIQIDATHDGGSVDFDKFIVEIGTKAPDDVAENLLHEIGEAITVMREFRYEKARAELDSADYRFLLTHDDWQLFAKDLSIAMRGIRFPREQ